MNPDLGPLLSPTNLTDYQVMEFLDGETLAERLQKGAVPVPKLAAKGSTNDLATTNFESQDPVLKTNTLTRTESSVEFPRLR